MDIIQVITRELNVEKWQVEAAVKLIDEGCTIPFISRYRKEATGTLNDEQLRNLNERLTYLRNLEDKKAQVLGSIEEQGKLTPELKKQIEAAQTLVVVEDLYRPYRPKRRTRAIIAREKGLGPLADIILLQMTKKPLEEEAKVKCFLSIGKIGSVQETETYTLHDRICKNCGTGCFKIVGMNSTPVYDLIPHSCFFILIGKHGINKFLVDPIHFFLFAAKSFFWHYFHCIDQSHGIPAQCKER